MPKCETCDKDCDADYKLNRNLFVDDEGEYAASVLYKPELQKYFLDGSIKVIDRNGKHLDFKYAAIACATCHTKFETTPGHMPMDG